jgi:hypothetical protein
MAGLAACSGGGGGTTGPTTGTIQITTVTSGTDGDPDGYAYSVDGGTAIAIANTGTASVTLPPGSHTVVFTGVSANCSATSPSTFTVTVSSGHASHADFTANCQVRYSVIGATTGPNPDIALLVAIDAGSWQLIPGTGTALAFPGLALGSHTLHIAGIATNCVLTGSADRTITVLDAVVVDPIVVTCSASTPLILFGSTMDGGHDLYTIHTDGSSITRITNGTPKATYGRYSPDGTKILYQNATGVGYDVAVMNANGTGSVSLTTDGSIGAFNRWPDWNPLGTKILFNHGVELYTMDPDGSHQTLLRTNSYHGRYSPDGNQIAFDDGNQVWLMDANGGNAHIIVPLLTAYNIVPSWSPDGTKILFVSPREGSSLNIFSVNPDGTGITNLTQSVVGDEHADQDFSPDGTKISYLCNPNPGVQGLCIMNANGSSQTNILPTDFGAWGTSWHP